MRWMRRALECAVLLGALICVSPASAQQPVRQSGTVTPGHPAMFITTGVIGDGGSAARGALTGLGVTASGPSICANSGPITGPFNRMCLGATQTGGGVLSVDNVGGGTGGFTIKLNGVTQGIATVTLPVTTNDGACFADTTGTLKDCGGIPVVIPTACSTAGAVPVWNGLIWTCSTASGSKAAIGANSPTLYTAFSVAGTEGDPTLTHNAAAFMSLNGTSAATALVFGVATTTPFPAWIQSRNWFGDAALGLLLQPSGGGVGINTGVDGAGNYGLTIGDNWTNSSTYAPPGGSSQIAQLSVYGVAGTLQGATVFVRTLGNASSAQGISSYAFANNAAARGAWPWYSEGHRLTNLDYAYGVGEGAAVNRESTVAQIAPFNTPPAAGAAGGLQLDCGNSIASTSYVQYSCSYAINFVKNAGSGQTNLKGFAIGLNFRSDSLDSTIYSPPQAIALAGAASSHAIVWWRDSTNLGWSLYSNSTSNANTFVLGDTGADVSGYVRSTVASGSVDHGVLSGTVDMRIQANSASALGYSGTISNHSWAWLVNNAEIGRVASTGLILGVTGTKSGRLDISGSSTGLISILPQAAAGTYNFNLPITAGAAGYVLTSQGGSAAVMTWSPARVVLTATKTFYVDFANGTDSATCGQAPSASACKNMQAAYDNFVSGYDCNGYAVTISVADSVSYTVGLSITRGWTGGCALSVTGNGTTPANVTVTTTSASSGLLYVNTPLPGTLTITGFKIISTNFHPIYNAAAGVIVFNNINFGAAVGWYHVYASGNGAQIIAATSFTYTISGGAAYHLVAASGGQIVASGIGGAPGVVTFTGSFNIGTYVWATRAGTIQASTVTYGSWTPSGTAIRWASDLNGVIDTGGACTPTTPFPGNSNGGPLVAGGQCS